MTELDQSPELAQRYGTGSGGPVRRARLFALLIAAVLVLAFGAWLAWAIAVHSRPPVASELLGYTISGPHEVEARVQVDRRDDSIEATCRVRALAADHSIVGEVAFTPEGRAQQETRVSIRSEREATSVELLGCTAPGQNRPQ